MIVAFPSAPDFRGPSGGSSGVSINHMYGTGEPRNSKERWLIRIVYWGTTILFAFLLWEYVKPG